MSQRRPLHEKLFRAVVVMGAALGASACYEHGSTSPTPPDGRLADAGKNLVDSPPIDVILIL